MIIIFYLFLQISHNIYFANLHSHTEFSDGQGLPEAAYLYARDSAQIDVLAITDHTHYLTENSYQYIKSIANRYTEDGRFIALTGQEFGSLNQFGHITIFEAPNLCPVPASDLNATYRWLNQNKLVTQFNHPREGDFNYLSYDYTGDKYCSTIEVVNGSGNYTILNEQMYFLALENGWHLSPVANQDNHRKKWGDATTSAGKIPLTGILAESLTKEAIIAAILNRRTYAMEVKPKSDRIRLKDFSIDNRIMGEIYPTYNLTILIRLEVVAETGFAKIYLYKNGLIYDSVNTQNRDSIVWYKTDSTSNAYYFVKGIQLDGDQFWSAPIWVEKAPRRDQLVISPNPLKTSSKIIISLSEPKPWPTLTIYNISGEKVYDTSTYAHPMIISSQFSLEWRGIDQTGKNLPNGIYLIGIKFDSGEIFKGKIAIER
uniref:Polymerase/histidinol phosphatase N-terminal domain-containing protein n=1 Tax=candidate division WOR-3 bacterium TaxID=2052148 RepID=A0A7C6EAI4_UNCW3